MTNIFRGKKLNGRDVAAQQTIKLKEAKCTTHCKTQPLLNLHQVHLSDPVFEISKTSQEHYDKGDERDAQETQEGLESNQLWLINNNK